MTENTVTKFCLKCQSEKSVLEFSKNKRNKDGLQAYCRHCRKERYENNKDKFLAYRKEYYQANKEAISAQKKEYREANKAKISEYRKEYYQANKAKISEYNKEYGEANKKAISSRMKEYHQTETGKNLHKKSNHKRRALKRGATVEDFSPTEVFERDGYRCQSCGIKTSLRYKSKDHPKRSELDHIVPLSLGGEHSKANTQCLCSHCNRVKHNTGTGDQLRMFG